MTDDKQKEYIKNLGNKCPSCGSSNISSCGCVGTDAGYAWQDMMCNACGAEWQDQYDLVGFSALTEGKKQ